MNEATTQPKARDEAQSFHSPSYAGQGNTSRRRAKKTASMVEEPLESAKAVVYREGEYNPENGKYVLIPKRTRPIALCFLGANFQYDGMRILLYYGNVYLRWANNAYLEIDETELKAMILRFLTESACIASETKEGGVQYVDFPANEGLVKAVLAAVKGLVRISKDIRSNSWIGEKKAPCDPKNLIFGPTRIYNWRSGKFLEPDPRWFNLSTLSVDVDPDAPKPCRFLRFLTELFGDDEEARRLLLEYCGLLLTGNTSFQKLLFIRGPKRGGKGTIVRLLLSLLGEKNVASPQTSTLGGRFGLQNLVGKSLAVIPDARFDGRTAKKVIEIILSITGEDALDIDHKNRDLVSMRLGARLMILSNEALGLPDASGAVVSRFLVLHLKQSFYGREDLSLIKTLQRELSGILNLFIQGLCALMARGHFVQPESGMETINEMYDLGNPVQSFVEEHCRIGLGLRCSTSTLFSVYNEWSLKNKIPSISSQVFGKNLRGAYSGIERREAGRGADGARQYFYDGIGIVSPFSTAAPPSPIEMAEEGNGVTDE